MSGYVFISYARGDTDFAQLAHHKLAADGVRVWADQHNLQAGDNWKYEIDKGIDDCTAVIVVLSAQSCASAYVTYEWASAMGKRKPIIPVLISDCEVHPKLADIHHLDFRVGSDRPWARLVQRIALISSDTDQASTDSQEASNASTQPHPADEQGRIAEVANLVLEYLNARGFGLVSFERIRENMDPNLSDQWLASMVRARSDVFRPAKLRGGKTGLARR